MIKSIRLRWERHVARIGYNRSSFKLLTGKPIGKRPLGNIRRRGENNIRMDLREIGVSTRVGLIMLWLGISGYGIIGEPVL